MDDFSRVKHVPIVIIPPDVSHGGTFQQPHGDGFPRIALAWLIWQFEDERDASLRFLRRQ